MTRTLQLACLALAALYISPASAVASDCSEVLSQIANKAFTNCEYIRNGKHLGVRTLAFEYADPYFREETISAPIVSAKLKVPGEEGVAGFGLFDMTGEDQITCSSKDALAFKSMFSDGSTWWTGSLRLDALGRPSLIRKTEISLIEVRCN